MANVQHNTITGSDLHDSAVPVVDSNGNELIKGTATGSAVNEITVTNAATGNAPSLDATGSDTNIDIDIDGKGSGVLKTQSAEVVNLSTAQTLTNKRLDARVGTTASSATPTPDADSHDVYTVTALAVNATFGSPTGTPVNGQVLMLRILDNGTTRTLAYNAIYRAIGVTLPTATTASKTIYLGCIYNSADTKWDVIGVSEEA